jgi:hypothetical protein
MKNINFIKAILVLLTALLFSGQTFSQSDYQIVQSFKDSIKRLEQSINSAKSLTELNSLVADIDKLRGEYTNHKELLNKSLYPDNFEKSFDKLNLAFVIRNQDFTTIDILQTENLQLKEQIIVLNNRNSELMNKIQDIELSVKKDKNKTNELKNLVAELKKSLNKRDELIFSIVDSLMPKLMKEKNLLTSKEQGDLYVEAEKNDLITNIKKSLRENIRFIYLTSLDPDDLKDIKKQQTEFSNFWQDAGVKLVDIYASKDNKSTSFADIDSLYLRWKESIETTAWINIRQEFAYNHIVLIEFYSSNLFTEVLTSYIDDEIRNIGVKSNYESEINYKMFVDSTWNMVMLEKWIPYLIDENILTIEQKNIIEAKINDWNARLTPESYEWIYYIVIIAAVAGLVFMNRKRIFKKSGPAA